jgi:hypothetical protein
MNVFPCTCCGEGGHRATKCKALSDPLKEGFYTGSGGGGSHSHDDDEHTAVSMPHAPPVSPVRSHISPDQPQPAA